MLNLIQHVYTILSITIIIAVDSILLRTLLQLMQLEFKFWFITCVLNFLVILLPSPKICTGPLTLWQANRKMYLDINTTVVP